MKDKYNDYEGETFKYSFPITFKKRNREYLNKRYDREHKQDYITPKREK